MSDEQEPGKREDGALFSREQPLFLGLDDGQQLAYYQALGDVLGKRVETMSKEATAVTLPHCPCEATILGTARENLGQKESSKVIFSNSLPLSIPSLMALCQRI